METGLKLAGCGVDAERSSRFEKLVGEEHPWPLVFSAREAAHARSTPNPAEVLCAAFCCKEALFKALQRPFSFPACEFLWTPDSPEGVLKLSPAIRRRFRICRAVVRILRPAPGELAAVVLLFV